MTFLPGVFNVTDTTYGIQVLPTQSAALNTTNLQKWVDLLLNATTGPTLGQGGTLQFPAYKEPYQFAGLINVGPSAGSIIFMGTGQASLAAPLLQQTVDSDLFFVANNPGPNAGVCGTTFQDLSIQYTVGSTATPVNCAIRITDSGLPNSGGSLNVRMFRVVFLDCPAAVTFQHCGECSMLQCTVESSGTNTNTQYGIIVGDPTSSANKAIETYIADCYFQTVQTPGQTAVAVYNSEHLRMMNTRVEAFQYGLVFKPSLLMVRSHFENVSIREMAATATTLAGALVIQPQSGANVYETAFVNCEFGPADVAGTKYTLGGVYIDARIGIVDVLRFVSCTSIGWPGPGLQILGGTTDSTPNCAHVEILGGEYSSNGQGTGTQQFGIYIGASGEAADSISNVRIAAASCVGSVLGDSASQQYGIYVTDGASNVIIDHCDLTGNAAAAAFVGVGSGGAPTNVFIRNCNATGYTPGTALKFTSPGTVEVTDCAGYNDQNTELNGGTAPTGAVSASSCTTPYYGPSLVMFSNPSGGGWSALTVHVSGPGYSMGFGSIYLPRPYDQIYFSSAPGSLTFHWIGK
jgi:hypothetical protein